MAEKKASGKVAEDRKDRLAAKLRENLAKRKSQSRARALPENDESVADKSRH